MAYLEFDKGLEFCAAKLDHKAEVKRPIFIDPWENRNQTVVVLECVVLIHHVCIYIAEFVKVGGECLPGPLFG